VKVKLKDLSVLLEQLPMDLWIKGKLYFEEAKENIVMENQLKTEEIVRWGVFKSRFHIELSYGADRVDKFVQKEYQYFLYCLESSFVFLVNYFLPADLSNHSVKVFI